MNKPCTKCEYAIRADNMVFSCDFRRQKDCEKVKKYRKYLRSKQKYKPGYAISDLETLMKQTFVYWHNRITHIEVIKSLQYRAIMRNIENRQFYEAVKNEKAV